MKKKLIYVSFIKLTDKVSRDWYIDYSIAKGALVEYWDIVSLVREEHEEHGALCPKYLRHIKTYNEYEGLIRQTENQNAVYVMLISYAWRFRKPYRILSKCNCKMVFLSWGNMPTTSSAPRWQRVIYRFFSNPVKFYNTVVNEIFGVVYRKINAVKRFDIVFASGKILNSSQQFSNRIVSFNCIDFDNFKRVELSDKKVINGKYAVLIDSNNPYHSDSGITGSKRLNADNYFKSLNRFMGLIEKKYDLKVVIAANPKSKYGNEKYENREFYRLQTAELVKNAEFVIIHQSTTLSYAVLNVKPVIFMYTDEMLQLYRHSSIHDIEGLASYLNASVYNVDQITDGSQVEVPIPNRDRYYAYKYDFLTSQESENISSAEIFWREIEKL